MYSSQLSYQTVEAIKSSSTSSLVSKNVRINKRRTSVRLEPEMWNALFEISEIECCSIHDLCSAVFEFKNRNTSFTAALRVFLMTYYRSAAFVDRRVKHVRKHILSLKH